MSIIASRDNPLAKRLRALAESGRERRKRGETLIEGAHLLSAALDAGLALEQLVLSDSAREQAEPAAIARRIGASAPVSVMTDALFAQCGSLESPSGIMAIFRTPETTLPDGWANRSVVVLDAVQDAGNLGTLLRTAAAAGIRLALLTEGCAQAWSPRVLRAGMGAHFVLDIVERVDARACLKAYHGAVIATVLDRDSRSVFDTDLSGAQAWLFGSEGQGVSAGLLERADRRVFIPMPGSVESLNVSAAAAICLFEQVRQRAVCA